MLQSKISELLLRLSQRADANEPGVVSHSDILAILRALDPKVCTTRQFQDLVEAAGAEGNGGVELEKLIHWLFGNPDFRNLDSLNSNGEGSASFSSDGDGHGPIYEDRSSESVHKSPGRALDAKEKTTTLGMKEWKEKRRLQKQQRQASKNKVGAQASTLHTHGFLSNLPEVAADVAYRFSFVVMGMGAEQLVKAVCASKSVADSMNITCGAAMSEGQQYRCMCPIPFQFDNAACGPRKSENGKLNPAAFGSFVPKMAKLMFTPLGGNSDFPVCRTRFEALSSALVFVLIINPLSEQISFKHQLMAYEDVIYKLQSLSKPLRPARAVLLCRNPDGCDCSKWIQELEEYEQIEEKLMKFGPVDLTDPAAIHASFGTFASSRISRGEQSVGEDSDGSQSSDAPPYWDAERDPDGCLEDDRQQAIFSDIGCDLVLGTRRSHSFVETASNYGGSVVPDAG